VLIADGSVVRPLTSNGGEAIEKSSVQRFQWLPWHLCVRGDRWAALLCPSLRAQRA